jgi:hypothetical protein
MASDGSPGKIPNTSPVHGSQAASSILLQPGSGKPLPPDGKTAAFGGNSVSSTPRAAAAAGAATKPAAQQPADLQAQINLLNKHLNDSGLPDQFRLDPAGKLIQQVNPANGAVIGEFAVSEFPALARGVGASGLLFDSLA